ncbi:atypical/PDHK/BCKDK protein kinase [Cantharellus anzutake]|uniref:atypical/PDHK/BCKDK protein kinase n=1 Tax=Cantharellus anzutake TaxID=1750568 RepID=UPI001906337A|nr:atypical/PDHK/BCKDK protein kinase [Cantharellus anzutake]KAF8343795.1 atypical/PDHK/BCKDK protein kinase [Cantharellus anzutake]
MQNVSQLQRWSKAIPLRSLGDVRHRGLRTPQAPSPEWTQLLEQFAELNPHPIHLPTLLSYGSPVTSSSVLISAGYTQAEIACRLARISHKFDKLPFICGVNPHISKVHMLYRNSFEDLASVPSVKNEDENIDFSVQLQRHINLHAHDIPTLSKGFAECAKYMPTEAITEFLDDLITSRIGVRLIAEQHVSLTETLASAEAKRENSSKVGVVDLECSPKRMIQMCASFVNSLSDATFGASPPLVIDGIVDAKFAYIPVHLEYIVTEILKNAVRASVEQHHAIRSTGPLPPVQATIAPSSSFLSLRIRDQGGGIHSNNLNRIFSYAFTTAGRNAEEADLDWNGDDGPAFFGEMAGKGLQTGLGTIAGLGYGLPLAKLYANYFGGQLDLRTLHGHGTDVFIKLRRLGENSAAEI